MAVVIGLLAILMGAGVGVTRRARRLDAVARAHSGEASQLEGLSVVSPPADSKAIQESAHWHDAVANEYRLAASRPWQLFDPDPKSITCQCGYYTALWARSTK
jgi:hypothetical protein